MPKLSSLLLLFFSVIGLEVVAQDTIPDYFPSLGGITDESKHQYSKKPDSKEKYFKMVHKTNPFSLIIGNTFYNSELRYMNETVLYKNLTLVLSGSYLFKGILLRSIENVDSNKLNGYPSLSLNGYRFQTALRFYPITRIKAPRGLWVGPHFSYLHYVLKPKNSSLPDAIEVTHWNVNLLLGYQFIAGRVCFDLYAGIGYKKNNWYYVDSSGKQRMDELYEFYPFYGMPLKLNFGANFGFAF